MREESYRAWLKQRGLAESSVGTYVIDSKRVEKYYKDLDELYDEDRLAGLLDELRYSAADRGNKAPNPSKIPIKGNPYHSLGGYRSTVTRYREYRDTDGSAVEHVDGTKIERQERVELLPALVDTFGLSSRRPWGVEERSDEASRAEATRATRAPEPVVVAKPTRRQFTAENRLRIPEEAGRCTRPGEVGRLLRREGLYTSHLSAWRKARRNGSLQGLTPKKRGAKSAESNPVSPKVRQLEAKVARLEKELATAHTILEVQGKVAGLPGFSLNDGNDC